MDEKEKDTTGVEKTPAETTPEATQPMESPPVAPPPVPQSSAQPPAQGPKHDWKTGVLIALACFAVLMLVAVLALSLALAGTSGFGHHGCRGFRGERGEKNEGRGYGMPMFRGGPTMGGSWPVAPWSSAPQAVPAPGK